MKTPRRLDFLQHFPTFIVIFNQFTKNLDKLYTRIFRMDHSIYWRKPHENPCSSFRVHRVQTDRRCGGLCFIICIDCTQIFTMQEGHHSHILEKLLLQWLQCYWYYKNLPPKPLIVFLTAILYKTRTLFECLLFGLKNRGLLILLLPDVSPVSVAGIFRGLGSWAVAWSLLNVLCLHHCTHLLWYHHVRGGCFWHHINCVQWSKQ